MLDQKQRKRKYYERQKSDAVQSFMRLYEYDPNALIEERHSIGCDKFISKYRISVYAMRQIMPPYWNHKTPPKKVIRELSDSEREQATLDKCQEQERIRQELNKMNLAGHKPAFWDLFNKTLY